MFTCYQPYISQIEQNLSGASISAYRYTYFFESSVVVCLSVCLSSIYYIRARNLKKKPKSLFVCIRQLVAAISVACFRWEFVRFKQGARMRQTTDIQNTLRKNIEKYAKSFSLQKRFAKTSTSCYMKTIQDLLLRRTRNISIFGHLHRERK